MVLEVEQQATIHEINDTWYRLPFCRQLGPYQTLESHSSCALLTVSFSMCFILRKQCYSTLDANAVQPSRTSWTGFASGRPKPMKSGSGASSVIFETQLHLEFKDVVLKDRGDIFEDFGGSKGAWLGVYVALMNRFGGSESSAGG